MNKQIKIFYDCFYFEEVAIELKKNFREVLAKFLYIDTNSEIEIIHLLDSDQEKKNWDNTIYFCFGLNRWIDMRNLPPNYVVMQFEPICIRGFHSENYLIICIRAMAIFEYSRLNIKIYREFNIPKNNIYLLEVGIGSNVFSLENDIETNYINTLIQESTKTIDQNSEFNLDNTNTGLQKIENTNSKHELKYLNNDVFIDNNINFGESNFKKDVDILFIGNITEYRQSVINKLRKKYPGKNIQIFENVWGKVRDRLVERSLILLNLHSNKENIFPLETPRLLYLSRFDVHIVSEMSGDLNEEKKWANRVHFCDNDFEILTNIFENKNFTNKINGKIPKLNCRLLDFIKTNNITLSNSKIQANTTPNIGRWFDIDCKIFETLNIEDEKLPNIHMYPLSNLPFVSIITLTTLERLSKWKDLMMWNNRHRVYHHHKLEWIIVIEKPMNKNEIKSFNKNKIDLNKCILKPTFIFYENRPREVYLQITEKRNLALEKCKYNFIDIMDDDDIEMPDALKIKMIILETFDKKCVGSKSIMCLDKSKNTIFVKNSHFPTESTLTFHKTFCEKRFSPSIHGEGSLMVLSQYKDVIDIPSSLNMIAITHESNLTGKSRSCSLEISSSKGFLKNLKMFLDEKKANELYEIII